MRQSVPIPGGVGVTPVRVQTLILPIKLKYFEQEVVREGVDFNEVHVTLAYVHSSSVLGRRCRRETHTSHHNFKRFLGEPFLWCFRS